MKLKISKLIVMIGTTAAVFLPIHFALTDTDGWQLLEIIFCPIVFLSGLALLILEAFQDPRYAQLAQAKAQKEALDKAIISNQIMHDLISLLEKELDKSKDFLKIHKEANTPENEAGITWNASKIALINKLSIFISEKLNQS